MIVDLVRNDLSHTAPQRKRSSEELCRLYSFKQVHQMISTIVSEVENSTSPNRNSKNQFFQWEV